MIGWEERQQSVGVNFGSPTSEGMEIPLQMTLVAGLIPPGGTCTGIFFYRKRG